ncbi:type VI secretion system tip protein TssI/VgrG [Pseudomonas moraviensis]|uniref:Type VI secretion system secreted protein VgrG n=1 Tax=Pseudomonas moraviensis TaxID=321662 RepID=A0A7Z0AUC7_9PSED|nr:type VI secretion system tip protein TssI/VgrG [Pseudomonas moraviensis]NYH09082.1 type VI secretion system secreted protein VgrG [Pseudomonas moraviensis]
MSEAVSSVRFTLQIPAVRNDFKVLAFEGSEAVSTLYAIKVELVSEIPDFDVESLLGQPAFLRFGLDGEGIHGRIEDVQAGESKKRLSHYGLTLVPELHYLQFSHDQRIFQNQTVPQIITQVLKRHGILADAFRFHVQSLPPRAYCTQYGESDFEFIQRLCAEEGIAWHHQHSAEGHLLVFTDDTVFLPTLRATPYRQDCGMVPEHPVVSRFSLHARTRTSHVTHRDYDLKRPHLLLESRFSAGFTPRLEDYRYPLSMENEKRGKQLARQALERHRADYETVEGQSNQLTLRSGHLFELTEHPRKQCNGLWQLLEVTHTGRQPQVLEEYATLETSSADGFTQGYRNSFRAIPADVVFRPPLPARRPLLVSQTARVTGPKGEEIYCDEFGRVKIEFHWDRAELNSERSSCWVRVSLSWAGNGFGSITLPRIGMEVVVTFLEGDPDQPLITGCVINKVTPAPYKLPEHKTRTVLCSRSSPDSGGYSELTIEDRAGLELIYLRAQRDMERQILHDSRLEVGRDRWESIQGNSQTTAGKIIAVEAGQQVQIKAGASVVLDAGANITLKAGGHHIVIDEGGIFSSTEILTDGKSTAGGAAEHPAAEMAGALAAGLATASTQDPEEGELEEEEEEVELEDEMPAGITLRIGVFFDGTGNNLFNSEQVKGCYARDVNLEKEAEDIQQFCQMHGYDGQGNVPDSSYGNDTSNVAKLYGLYRDDQNRQLSEDETIAYIPIYLDGIGTSTNQDDSVFSQMTGTGAQGVLAKVKQSRARIFEGIDIFKSENPIRKVKTVQFDIFGFSRGAAAARHFANEVMKGEQSPLAQLIPANSSLFLEDFAWRTNIDVSINFIGIFDTAAAIGSMADGDFSVHDANNPGVNLYLAPDIAKKVVHLVARDERRHNFSLNSAGNADIVLPGVHSDLGGGYLPNLVERVLLSRPRCSRDVDFDTPSSSTNAYRLAEQELGRLQDQLHLYGLTLQVKTWAVETVSNVKGDRRKSKNVYAAVYSERVVRNDLSLIYLRIMRELATRHGVEFETINEEARSYALPEELMGIARKMMTFALGESRSLYLSLNEHALLAQRYIHLSSNWNAAKGLNESGLSILFINRPADKSARVVHPNA